jgi:NADPH:quinone reductase
MMDVEKEAMVMRAIGLTEFGGPEVLRVIELPDPVPGTGEVRIRVHAASVSPTDTLLRAGAAPALFEGRPGPYVPGMDAAGVVDAIGPDTDTSLRPGDPVIAIVRAYGPRGGAYAELVVAPAESVVPIPSDVDFPAASTLLMNALTARVALDLLTVPAGRTVAVTGAAGAFGGYAVQLAKNDGLCVLADASAADTQLVASLGADEVVLRGDDVADRFRALAPDGVDAVLDGATLNELVLPAIRDGGGLAVIRGWNGPVDRGIHVHPVWVTGAATDHARLLRLRDQASAGELTLRVADILPADQAAQAHRRLAEGAVRGRLVLDFTAF